MPLFIFLRFFIIFLLTFSALNVTIKLTGYHTKKIPVSTRGEIPMNRFFKAMAAVASAAALTVSGAGSSFSAVLTSPAATANAVDDGNPHTGVSAGFGLLAVCAVTAGAALAVKKRKNK